MFSFLKTKKDSQEKYLGLFLKEEEGILMVMQKVNSEMVMIEKERFNYSNGWENLSEDIDDLLFRLEKKIGSQISKTIFFVYSHLVDEKIGDIKKLYLQKIKEFSKNLELEPIGYIECYEAVLAYLEKKEEVPLTALILELDTTEFTLFIYKGGKLSHKKNISRTDNLIDDLTKELEEYKGRQMLPARIILYNSKDLDQEATKIISHRWGEEYFVQIPRINIIKEEEINVALIKIFNEQIGGKTVQENQKVMGFVINEDVEEKKTVAKNHLLLAKQLIGKIPKIKYWTPIIGAFMIIFSLFLNEYFFHQADLLIYLPFYTVKKELILDIPFKIATETAQFSETIATTGQKDIGDAAKGEVTVHNFDDKEKAFNKGTVLTTNNIQFILDSDVKVASSTIAADGSAKLPGKSKAAITALNIGPQGNLAKDQRFKIDDLSSSTFFAINEAALTGGSKKEVRTVAKKDYDQLTNLVLEKAKKQEQKQSELKSFEAVSDFSQVKLDQPSFSKELGEEGDKLSLKTNVLTTFYAYAKNSILAGISKELTPEVKNGFNLEKQGISYNNKKVIIKDNRFEITTSVKAKITKQIKKEEIVKLVLGRNKNNLSELLKEKFNIEGYDLKIIEPLPMIKDYLPVFNKNIFIKLSSL